MEPEEELADQVGELGEGNLSQNDEQASGASRASFSRLDPTRRSLSTPNIQMDKNGAGAKPTASTSTLNFCKRRHLQMRLRRATRPSAQMEAPEVKGEPTKAHKPNTSRRRSALGLISSLGFSSPAASAISSSANQAPKQSDERLASANQTRDAEQQTAPTAASSSWRNWFTSAGGGASRQAANQAAGNQLRAVGEQKRHQQATENNKTRPMDSEESPELADAETSANSSSILIFLSSSSSSSSSSSPVDEDYNSTAATLSNQAEEQPNGQQPKDVGELPTSGNKANSIAPAATPTDETESLRREANGYATSEQKRKQRQLSASSSSSSIVTICMAPQASGGGGGSDSNQATGLPTASSQPKHNQRQEAQSSNVIEMAAASGSVKPTLVDLLIDSQLDWRQLISEANQGQSLSAHLSEVQIKRQEIIHELIQTERHHCLTLALMRQVYLSGLLKLNELRQRNATASSTGTKRSSSSLVQQQQQHQQQQQQLHSQEGLAHEPIDIERLFPALEELIQAHELFFAHLRLRLVECCSAQANGANHQLVGIIGPLGDLLINQFQLHASDSASASESLSSASNSLKKAKHKRAAGCKTSTTHESSASNQVTSDQPTTNGAKLLQAYAKFCGQHYESSRYFKQLMQFDKGFKQFIEQCNKQHPACRQRGIPECNLLVAQRLTKYPLLIEQLIKTSKDEANEEETKLRQALTECRAILAELNAQLARKESFERLLDIYAQFSPKSSTVFYHKQALKFTKHDLLQHKRLRQLLHADDQVRLWSAQRRKLFPVLCLILNDIIVFLRVEPTSSSSGSSPLTGNSTGMMSGFDQVVETSAGSAVSSAAVAAADFQDHHHHHYQWQPTTTTSMGAQQLAPTGGQMRYYFANVDNKSSVISLSKLLVREKAVEEAEPRIYLISSSPKQPEMYELAFVSRRHQANFVDKLHTSIESHQQAKMGSCLRAESHKQLSHMSNESLSSCCSDELGDTDSSSSSDFECDESDHNSSAQQLERQIEQFIELNGGPEAVAAALVAQSSAELDELKLDIEEALLPEPGDQAPSTTSSISSSHSSATTGGADDDDSMPLDSREDDANNRPAVSPGGSPTPGGLCERARDSCDELAVPTSEMCAQDKGTVKPRMKSVRRRRFQRPRQVSNQSSSSDSGNSSGTTNTETEPTRPIELDLKATACRQLEDQNGTNEDLDSGRGHDSSAVTSSASSSAGCNDSLAHKLNAEDPTTPTAEDFSSSSQSTTAEDRSSEKDEERLGSLESQLASTPKASLSKLARKCEQANKMRKLSSVSSISNQIKLIQRLRSVGLLDTAATMGNCSSGDSSSAGYCSPPNQQQVEDSLGSLEANSVSAHVLLAQHKRRLQQSRRRSLFIPEQKLEELRNLRIKLDKDKQEWQEKFDRMQEQLLNERRELDLAREKLKLERQQVENEREQLYRKLDLLKENGILLSPSHKIIITSPQQQPSPAQSHYQALQYQHQQQQVYSINQNQQNLQMQDQHRLASLQQQQQYHAANNPNYQQRRAGQQQPLSRVPLYLSQQSLSRAQSNQNLHPSNQLQQQPQAQQQKHYTSRVPFISVLPGASFLVKRFSSSGSSSAACPPIGDGEIIQARI